MSVNLNEMKLKYFQNLDNLLEATYREGENLTQFDQVSSIHSEIFPSATDSSMPVHHPQLKTIEFLIQEDFIGIRNGKYFLTGRGIHKLHANGFAEEYVKSFEQYQVLQEVQQTTIHRNKLSLKLSTVALILSFISIVLTVILKIAQ